MMLLTMLNILFFQVDESVERQAYTMGSVVNFVVKAENAKVAHLFINKQLSLFQKYDKLWSLYSKESLLTKINSNAGKDTTRIDKASYELLMYAKDAYKRSNHLFNIAILPLLNMVWFLSTLKE